MGAESDNLVLGISVDEHIYTSCNILLLSIRVVDSMASKIKVAKFDEQMTL